MKCPNCGFENPAEARFCMNCGTGLTGAPQDHERLRRLQSALPKALAEKALAGQKSLEGERRQVTILFADVVGSTALAEKRDPEEAKVILEECLTLMTDQIYRYEGIVTSLMGDGLMAFFGAPVAHEDDPERAIRAALGIRGSMIEYSEELNKALGVEVQVRIGLNTGEVVVGGMGSDLRMEYTGIGDAVNLAARMQAAAPPGEILITGSTYRLVSRLFEFGALGEIVIKGREEAVEAYLVKGVIAEPMRVRGIEGLRSPMVGRDEEREKLLAAVQNLLAEKGQIVAVVGEVGIGKTRLVEEVREATAGRDILWLEGRALSYGQSLSLWLFQDVVRNFFGILEGDSSALVRIKLKGKVRVLFPKREGEILPYLASLLSVKLEGEMAERIADLHPEAIKRRIFVVVGELLERAAEVQPIAIVLEDLHWADPTSIELLKGFLTSTDRAPIMILCLFRPETELPSWEIREIASREFRHRYTEIALYPLPQEESSQLVENLLAVAELPQGIKRIILEKAEGNPFFLEEVIRALIEEGVLVLQNGRWRATAQALTLEIPDTVQGVIRARIDRLKGETRQVLQIASVIGKSFLYPILAQVAQMDGQLDEHLSALQRRELIVEKARRPEREYAFKHVLTQEVAYSGLLLERRKEFHRRVAEAIEALFPERLEEFYGMLGRHWSQAGVREKAISYLLQAGDKARLAYAYQEAEDYYNRALEHLREVGDRERKAATLMKLGLTYHIAGDYEQVTRCYEEAFSLWHPVRPPHPAVAGGMTLRLPLWSVSGRLWSVYALDPARAEFAEESAILYHLFEGLARHDREGNVVPAAALAWEITEGGTHYLFRLRPDLRWSDGQPVTAQDFEYAWKRILNPSTKSPMAALLYPIRGAKAFHLGETGDLSSVGIKALDEDTLEVRLEAPIAYFLHLVCAPGLSPQPRWAIEAHGLRWTEPAKIVSNGPFSLLEFVPGARLVVERNPLYAGSFLGNLQRVEGIIVSDWSHSLPLYEADEFDITGLHDKDMERAKSAHGSEMRSVPVLATFYLGFVVNQEPVNDPQVRRALVHAVDREGWARSHFQRLATGGFVPAGLAGHSPNTGLHYDPKEAQRLLSGGKRTRGPEVRNLKLFVAKGAEPWVAGFVTQWRDLLGIQIRVQALDFATLVDALGSDPPHMYLLGRVAEYPDPSSFLSIFHSRSQANPARWKSEEFDRLLEQAERLPNQSQRMSFYQRADEILVLEEVVVMPLSYRLIHYLVKPWVKGFQFNLLQQADLRQVFVEHH